MHLLLIYCFILHWVRIIWCHRTGCSMGFPVNSNWIFIPINDHSRIFCLAFRNRRPATACIKPKKSLKIPKFFRMSDLFVPAHTPMVNTNLSANYYRHLPISPADSLRRFMTPSTSPVANVECAIRRPPSSPSAYQLLLITID